MGTIATAKTLVTGAVWRATGSERLAESLIRTATSEEEDAATVAVMALTGGGSRAVAPVRRAIARGEVDLVPTLVGIGSPTARAALVDLADHPDPTVATASRTGLDQLDRAEDRRR